MPLTEYGHFEEKIVPAEQLTATPTAKPTSTEKPAPAPKTPTEIADLMKALSHETRIEIMIILLYGPATVSDFAVALECSQPAISKHLKILTNMKLIENSVDGRNRVYKLANQTMGDFVAEIAGEREATPFLETLPPDGTEVTL